MNDFEQRAKERAEQEQQETKKREAAVRGVNTDAEMVNSKIVDRINRRRVLATAESKDNKVIIAAQDGTMLVIFVQEIGRYLIEERSDRADFREHPTPTNNQNSLLNKREMIDEVEKWLDRAGLSIR